MKEIMGTSNRILEIHLATKEVREFKATDTERKMYLGGKGLGLKYLCERLTPGMDPLDADNILAFMMGVLMGTGAPCSGRFAAITKSPLTGIMVASSCGGPFGMAYKTAGYDGLLITGKSDTPIYLRIDADGVSCEDATHLWGKDTQETQELLGLEKKDGALVIGPAGEHQVLYANIASGHRFLGRGGMGAVMGAKNLKAIAAFGKTHKIVPLNPEAFKKACKKAARYINNNKFTSEVYRNFGTNANVTYCNKGGILPVRNFRDGCHEDAEAVSGETMQKKYDTVPSTCKPCSILCGHKGTYADGEHQIPEYETVGMLGTNIGIFDPDLITEWNDICSRMGMDTITAGATLAYVMEAGEKELIQTDLKFGDPDGVSDILRDIALRQGQGDEFANGTRRLSRKYGGEEFAIHVKGLEMAAYDPRGSWGHGLAYAVANRGACHLSATLMVLEVFFGFLHPHTPRAKAQFVCFLESLYAAVNSLHTCLFTSFAYMLEPPAAKHTPKPLLGAMMQYLPFLAIKLMDVRVFSDLFSAVTGIRMSQGEMLEAGDRIHTLERYMNTREGISRKDDTLPARFLEEGRECDPEKRTVPIDQMLDKYYKLRGYDANGIPTPERLEKLGLAELLGIRDSASPSR